MFVWNWWGVPGLLAMALAFAGCVIVYTAAPTRSPNRRLAVVFFFEGVGTGLANGLIYFLVEARWAYAAQSVAVLCFLVLPFFYLWFLGTLPTPLTRVFRSRLAGLLLGGCALVVAGLWYFERSAFIEGVAPTAYTAWEGVNGPIIPAVFVVLLAFYIFALVVSLLAYASARTKFAKERAIAFALAFGARDIIRILLLVSLILFPSEGADWRAIIGVPLSAFVFFPLLGYGVLRAQLFDIDLRVKTSLRRSLVASAFVIVFFVVSQAAEEILNSTIGSVAGFVAAATLALALKPIERAADRIADTVMPTVEPTAAYLERKRLEVYRGAVEGIVEDGRVSDRERAVLVRLRARLAIPSAEAAAIERDVLKDAPA